MWNVGNYFSNNIVISHSIKIPVKTLKLHNVFKSEKNRNYKI